MNGLLEFVFEGIRAENVAKMVAEFVPDDRNVVDVFRDGEPLQPSSLLKSNALLSVVSGDEDTAYAINLRSFSIGGKRVINVTIRILHYDGVNDASVLASSADCKAVDITTAHEVFRWAQTIAEKYCVSNFYGGLDPAFDEQTQLYSAAGIGPIVTL